MNQVMSQMMVQKPLLGQLTLHQHTLQPILQHRQIICQHGQIIRQHRQIILQHHQVHPSTQ